MRKNERKKFTFECITTTLFMNFSFLFHSLPAILILPFFLFLLLVHFPNFLKLKNNKKKKWFFLLCLFTIMKFCFHIFLLSFTFHKQIDPEDANIAVPDHKIRNNFYGWNICFLPLISSFICWCVGNAHCFQKKYPKILTLLERIFNIKIPININKNMFHNW